MNDQMDIWQDFEKRWALMQEQKESGAKVKLGQLDKETKLLPLKRELLAHIEAIIAWLDLSGEWFLKSRDLTLSDEERKLNLVIYEFYRIRSDLILEELSDFLPKEFQNG